MLHAWNLHSDVCQLLSEVKWKSLMTVMTPKWTNIFKCLRHKVTFFSSEVTQSYPTLCDPMDYTVRGILQARILKCLPFSRGSCQSRDWSQVSCITVDSLPAKPPGKLLSELKLIMKFNLPFSQYSFLNSSLTSYTNIQDSSILENSKHLDCVGDSNTATWHCRYYGSLDTL